MSSTPNITISNAYCSITYTINEGFVVIEGYKGCINSLYFLLEDLVLVEGDKIIWYTSSRVPESLGFKKKEHWVYTRTKPEITLVKNIDTVFKIAFVGSIIGGLLWFINE
jgi:hypothetical protein